MHLARAAGHRPPLGRPCDRKDVEHVGCPLVAYRLRSEVGSSAGPRHAAAPGRRPEVVCRAEVLVERSGVEAWERTRPCEAVDVARLETGVRDCSFRGFGADLARGPARCLRIRRLADADDRDFSADVVQCGRVSPVT